MLPQKLRDSTERVGKTPIHGNLGDNNKMALIEEIQREAVDSNSDLGAVLRKCKLLAARLQSSPLEDWLLWESNGYPDHVEVPSYRTWPLEVKGHFVGPFGSGLQNAPIPFICLPEKVRHSYDKYKCRQSIASIDATIKKFDPAKGDTLCVSTGDLAVKLGKNVYRGQNCLQAWAEFPVTHLVEVLNAVRNRILDFALAVWKEAPTAGEGIVNASPEIGSERVTHIFNTTVYGGAANLVGSATSSSVSFTVSQEGLEDLRRLVDVFEHHFDDLSLDGPEKQKARVQVATIKAQLGDDPDPVIVRQAGCTLRNLTEGTIASLIATAAQPTVWSFVPALWNKLFG